MKRWQTFHETLIPLLVEGIGAKSYLEFGTHENQTFNRVECKRKYGVDCNSKDATFNMTTAEFIKNHAEELAPFDFVFIDADHSEQAVRDDFYGILPYVSDEGLICLHDTNPEKLSDTVPDLCADAWKCARDISLGREAVTLPYHPGLTIIRNRLEWGPE